jgi:phosphatidylinositol glycan class U
MMESSLRSRKQPLFVITTILGISAIFKSYPSIGDTALYLSLLSLYRHVFPCMSSIQTLPPPTH